MAMNNLERIRSMGMDEIAKMLICPYETVGKDKMPCLDDPDPTNKQCMDCIKKWLKKDPTRVQQGEAGKIDTLTDMLCTSGKGLVDYLVGNGFLEAPAAAEHHSNYKGGLYEHSLQVAYELADLTHRLGLKWQRPESPGVIGLLHDVCKMDAYKRTEAGYEYSKECLYPGHGEKSLIMLLGHAELTEEEKVCIRYHMGSFTDEREWRYYTRAVQQYPNVLYTHMADMIASQIKGV